MRIALASGDIGAAVRGAELVLIPTPAIAQDDIARAIAPHLADGQVVFLPPGTFGSYVMARIVRAAGNRADVTYAETGTLPYLARKHGAGRGGDHHPRHPAAHRRVSRKRAARTRCAVIRRPTPA